MLITLTTGYLNIKINLLNKMSLLFTEKSSSPSQDGYSQTPKLVVSHYFLLSVFSLRPWKLQLYPLANTLLRAIMNRIFLDASPSDGVLAPIPGNGTGAYLTATFPVRPYSPMSLYLGKFCLYSRHPHSNLTLIYIISPLQLS